MTLGKTVALLRVLLALFFFGLVVAQVAIMPGTLSYHAEHDSDVAYWPLLTVAIVELLCVQIVVVCTWVLLSRVRGDRIFSERSLVWVDAIVWTIGLAWLLLLGVFLYLTIFVADDPGVPVIMMGMLLAGGSLGLLMIVMRALLRQATALRSDMDAVI